MALTVRGTVMQTPTVDALQVLADVVIDVGDDGLVASIVPAAEFEGEPDVRLGADERLLPGLVDLHVHAPQWPQLGTGLDLPLDEWLFRHTFPLEARYESVDFAEEVWSHLVPSLLANGTTTAVYYGSIHVEATTALARTCVDHGQRALVGRTAMDHEEGTPEWYRDPSASASVERSAASIEAIDALGSPSVRPIVTPRFIPACSDAALTGLGELAASNGTPVQTHCSENDWEHGHVLDRFGVTDAEALDGFGLLVPETVLAHGGHLLDGDLARLRERRAGVAHCPLSNVYFGDAVFPVRRALDAGVRVGLGTDIAGGPSPSIFTNAAQAVTSARMLDDGVDPALAPERRGRPGSRIDIITAFWLATLGGAEVIGSPVGLIEVGRPFDAVAVATGGSGSAHWGDEIDDDARLFEKIVRSTGPERIAAVWVDGRLVSGGEVGEGSA